MQLQESESVQQLESTMKECIERLDSQVQLLVDAQINAAAAAAAAARTAQ